MGILPHKNQYIFIICISLHVCQLAAQKEREGEQSEQRAIKEKRKCEKEFFDLILKENVPSRSFVLRCGPLCVFLLLLYPVKKLPYVNYSLTRARRGRRN